MVEDLEVPVNLIVPPPSNVGYRQPDWNHVNHLYNSFKRTGKGAARENLQLYLVSFPGFLQKNFESLKKFDWKKLSTLTPSDSEWKDWKFFPLGGQHSTLAAQTMVKDGFLDFNTMKADIYYSLSVEEQKQV